MFRGCILRNSWDGKEIWVTGAIMLNLGRRKFGLLIKIQPSMSINPKNNRDLFHDTLVFLSEFVVTYRVDKHNMSLIFILRWMGPWRSIASQNNRDLKLGVLPFWSKYGDYILTRWQIMARTNSGRTHRRTRGHRDRQTLATTIPKGQNWPQ